MSNFKPRLISSILILIIFIIFFTLRSFEVLFFDAFIGIFTLIAAAEVSRVYIRSKRYNFMDIVVMYPVLFFFINVLMMTFEFDVSSFIVFHILLLAALFLLSFVLAILQGKKFDYDVSDTFAFAYVKSLRTFLILLYPAFLLNLLFIINNMDYFSSTFVQAGANLGFLALVMIFSVSIASDAFAYFAGNIFKGKKLAPLISPNKTISGAVGGVVGGALVSITLFLIFNSILGYDVVFANQNITLLVFVIYGVFGSIISQMGDLFASIIKRDARAKDFSSIFPGHGGVMDRLDSVAFNTLFTLIFVIVYFI